MSCNQKLLNSFFFTRHGVMLATHKSCSSQGAMWAHLAQQTTRLQMQGLSRAGHTTDPNSLLHDRVLRFGQRAPAQKTACHAVAEAEARGEVTSDVPAHGPLGVPSSLVAGTFSEQAWRREGRGGLGRRDGLCSGPLDGLISGRSRSQR